MRKRFEEGEFPIERAQRVLLPRIHTAGWQLDGVNYIWSNGPNPAKGWYVAEELARYRAQQDPT